MVFYKVQPTDFCSFVNVHIGAIIGTFNAYVELTGCTSTKHPSSLGDDTPLLHLLSYSTENESSNDLLYAVICDVVCISCTI